MGKVEKPVNDVACLDSPLDWTHCLDADISLVALAQRWAQEHITDIVDLQPFCKLLLLQVVLWMTPCSMRLKLLQKSSPNVVPGL